MKGGVGSDLLYTACGTPYYCAPEIINGAEEGYSGVKIDAWSCGIILYLLLTGVLPFQHDDMTRLYELINACKVPYPSWMGSDAKDLICHLLVKDPEKRFSLEDVKKHSWFLVDYDTGDTPADSGRSFGSGSDRSKSRSRKNSASNGGSGPGRSRDRIPSTGSGHGNRSRESVAHGSNSRSGPKRAAVAAAAAAAVGAAAAAARPRTWRASTTAKIWRCSSRTRCRASRKRRLTTSSAGCRISTLTAWTTCRWLPR
eukprot:TRINITY_DN124_c1_g1_i2.p1 TRINITY_DN124_c1_g1~~TRINITY_DN124_c1_g1_i2.p1  ORF type:complete len:256 (+),score=58.99 TRINITY_DN124_c1_g1_i2:202-969(+)